MFSFTFYRHSVLVLRAPSRRGIALRAVPAATTDITAHFELEAFVVRGDQMLNVGPTRRVLVRRGARCDLTCNDLDGLRVIGSVADIRAEPIRVRTVWTIPRDIRIAVSYAKLLEQLVDEEAQGATGDSKG